MGKWRNRVAMREEPDPRNVWFTSYGEVKALVNGSPEESVSGKDSSSISDIVNQLAFPDLQVRLIAEHSNILLIFTEAEGYAIVGTAGILDNIGTRGISSEHFVDEGAAGPNSGISTPFGFAWMTSGRKINLWVGGQKLVNIGDPIKTQLDTIPEGDLRDVTLYWWDGNGRKWLVVCAKCADSDNLTGSATYRALIYDFDLATEQDRPGEWIEWTDHTYTAIKGYRDGAQRFLLGGDASGNVYQLDTISNPSHLNRSMILGKTYAGSSISNNPVSTIRTGLMVPNNDQNATGLYVSVVRGSQAGPSTSLGSNPAITCAVDSIDPDTAPGISLTLGSAFDSGEYHAWLAPESGGEEAGALGKQFQIEAAYAAGSSNNAEADGRLTVALEALYKLAFSWTPQADSKA
jgi:hypothetical protein